MAAPVPVAMIAPALAPVPAAPPAPPSLALPTECDLGADFGADFEQAEQFLSALSRGRDPLRSARGDLRLAYRSGADRELVPFRILVPDGYSPRERYPFVGHAEVFLALRALAAGRPVQLGRGRGLTRRRRHAKGKSSEEITDSEESNSGSLLCYLDNQITN